MTTERERVCSTCISLRPNMLGTEAVMKELLMYSAGQKVRERNERQIESSTWSL